MFNRAITVAATMLHLLVFAAANAAEAPAAPKDKPNIIVIMSDDMGWSDLGCYGSNIETPNLDALAKDGVRFTQFYNTARCCPTRACLLTGLYPHQAGMGHMTGNCQDEDGYRGELNNRCVTIAEAMHTADYKTYAIGKWHVTTHAGPNGPKFNWPLQRGFDKYYGLIWGASSQFDPAVCRGNTYYTRENDPEYQPKEFYFTQALSDNAVTFLKQHQTESPDKPFFMYVAYTAAHWPMQALEKDIAKYKGKFDGGYEAMRQARVEKLKKLGLIDPNWQVTPGAKKWSDVKDRQWETRCMEVYAAMIDSMDQGIGKIVNELKRENKFDNTLILFMEDNGGCAEEIGRQPVKKEWPTYRPLGRDELPASGHPRQARDGRAMKSGPGVMPGGPDTYIAYGEGWANVSNTPFREYKHWVHEGGISTPLIAHWPDGIAPELRDKLVSSPAHLIDIMATCVDLGKAKYPAEKNGQKIVAMQGVSLRPAFEGKPLERKEPLFWEHEGNRAVRDGKWKLVAKADKPWELYDMEVDRTEMHDLSKEKPEMVSAMAAKWDAWAARSNVLPLGTWRKARERKDAHSTATVFELKTGLYLDGPEAPASGDRALTVTAEILQNASDGVILAQGAITHGYALYMKDNKLCFSIRRERELVSVSAALPSSKTPLHVGACIEADGKLRLLAEGRELAAAKAAGPLVATPVDSLSVGEDSGETVGEYESPFAFQGKLGQVRLELAKK